MMVIASQSDIKLQTESHESSTNFYQSSIKISPITDLNHQLKSTSRANRGLNFDQLLAIS